jgi:hypothetical protein
MLTTKIRATTIALAAAFSFAGASLVPAVSQADTKTQGPAKGCPVENSNGTTSTVAVGTRIGLFYCGADGEWHFGWLVNGRTEEVPPKPVVGPVALTSATTRL